ncbi:MAG: hypothetical protein RSE13_14295 [Planktothrix sp. GU0601_MAG3]|nr:MAG: hypothetical protein RSE13_14295 [Planktothrix sp. GU0601_MAG3]
MGIPDLVSQRNMRLLTFSVIAVGGTMCPIIIPALAAAGTVATGVGAIITGIASGVVATDMIAHHQDQLSVKLRQSKDSLANEDLIKASGLAVGLLIRSVAESGKYPQRTSRLEHLATYAAKQWTKLIYDSHNRELNELTPLQEKEINTLFAKQGKDFFEQTVLTIEDWRIILRDQLCNPAKINLEAEIIDDLAENLHRGFPKALREVLKIDFEEGGKAFAGFTISMLGEILAILRNASSMGNNETILAGLQQIETLQQQLQQSQEAKFKQLGTEIESGFDAVLQQLGITQTQIQELRGWLSEELQTLQETMTAGFAQVGEQNQELKQTVETGF